MTSDARRPRILHAPIDIGGHASGLAAAQRKLGYDAICVSLYPSPQSGGRAVEPVAPGAGLMAREIARWRLLWCAARESDIIHLYFGETLLMPRRHPDLRAGKALGPAEIGRRLYARAVWGKDLPLLKALGKRLVFSFLGDDVRQRAYTATAYEISIAKYADPDYYPPRSDEWKRRVIGLAEHYAEVIFAYNPDLLNVLPAGSQLLPYSHLFAGDIGPVLSARQGGPIRIAHAPTHFGAKGTRFVLAAVARLRAEGVEFEFDLIQGASHEEAMDRIARCDLFIDQLLAGWYGGAAVEAMLLGKPVIAYIRDSDCVWLPPDLRRDLPIVSATPVTLAAVLRNLLARDHGELRRLGQESRRFAERYHDPVAVARRVMAALGLTG
ncbi:MAG: glycosyltransferase [Alphaproteobacteria bacterium]